MNVNASDHYDLAVIGGGIVGLATAYRAAQRQPGLRVVVLEKENALAHHQTGHNSGVLHSGIYYKPGSLKATNCRAGKKAMEGFCEQHGIPFKLCGKVIVAVREDELPKLHDIYARGQANGVDCALISAERCREIEPHCPAIAAIHVPEAGIVDYRQVCAKLGELLREAGHDVRTGARVTGIRRVGDEHVVQTAVGDVAAKLVVNCGGLQCDRVSKMTGVKPAAKIVPFRGEYFVLKPEAEHLCKTLIYPVPDPAFPFLGVHFTSMVHGGVECGPNAVLALGRECYGKFAVNPKDLFESLTYPGFLKMAAKHWRMGAGEMWRSYSKRAFVRALQRLMPEIEAEHLVACPSGIRAQAVTADGGLVDDFLIDEARGVINVNNAPSPAATASLNIGELITDRIE
ncbi:MAG: L-2-hydroxyglutarate oxidase, partial [Planctomycetota bacterium]